MDLLKGIGFDDDYLVFGLNDGRFVAALNQTEFTGDG